MREAMFTAYSLIQKYYVANIHNQDDQARAAYTYALNLFGPKGSGKSELGHSLMSFFIIENTPPNIQNSTLPALADAVVHGSTLNWSARWRMSVKMREHWLSSKL